MSAIQAFNTMLKEFVGQLCEVFPEETQLAIFLQGFDTVVALDESKPLATFVEAIQPHGALVMARNPELFDHLRLPGIDFRRLWATPDLSDNTRQAIWQYISTLYVLGTTVRSVSPEVLSSIESIAQNLESQMQSGQLDLAAMGSVLGGLLGSAATSGPGAGPDDDDDGGAGDQQDANPLLASLFNGMLQGLGTTAELPAAPSSRRVRRK
jgi:hypothetical protein